MKTKGFTLVELLVVIAILAILATVSVVGYTSFINQANNSTALQEVTQVRDYCISYDLTGGDKNGKVSVDEVTAAIALDDLKDKAANVDTTGTFTKDTVTYHYVTYTLKDASNNVKGTAYWILETGEVTTTKPE